MDERVSMARYSATVTRQPPTAYCSASLPFAFSSNITDHFEHTVPYSGSHVSVLRFSFVFPGYQPTSIPIEPHSIAAKGCVTQKINSDGMEDLPVSSTSGGGTQGYGYGRMLSTIYILPDFPLYCILLSSVALIEKTSSLSRKFISTAI